MISNFLILGIIKFSNMRHFTNEMHKDIRIISVSATTHVAHVTVHVNFCAYPRICCKMMLYSPKQMYTLETANRRSGRNEIVTSSLLIWLECI